MRELMIAPTPNTQAINTLVDSEIKTVLRDKLKAAVLESVDPLYPDDPSVPNLGLPRAALTRLASLSHP